MGKGEHSHAPRGRLIRRWARIYDPVSWLMSLGRAGAVRRQAVALADPRGGEKVLDVGCGTGALAFEAKALAPMADVTGIDASPEMIAMARAKARKRRQGVRFLVAGIESLPFEEGRFDAVLSGYMLHHLPPEVKREGLLEVARVLKPGGRLSIVDFSGAGGGFVGHVMSALGHGHSAVDRDRLIELLDEVGFDRVEVVPTRFRSQLFVRAVTRSS